MRNISTFEAYTKMLNSDGRIFTALFIKKDGSLRVMTCRLGVKKGIKGVGMSYSPAKKGLLSVYDLNEQDYRMINVETLQRLTIDGESFSVGNVRERAVSVRAQDKLESYTPNYKIIDAGDFEQTVSRVFGCEDWRFEWDWLYKDAERSTEFTVANKVSAKDYERIANMKDEVDLTPILLNALCSYGVIKEGLYKIEGYEAI